MAYSWFRVDSSIVDHPKVMRLAELLEEPLAVAYVLRLWSWVQRYAPTGLIPKDIVPQLERFISAGKSDPHPRTSRIQTMAEVGLLEIQPGGFRVHDWEDFQGKLVEKSKRDAKKKRLQRRGRGAKAARAVSAPKLSRNCALTDVTDVTNTTKAIHQVEPRISIVDPPDDTEARFIEFLGWKSSVRRERKLPVDCTPPKRTADRDWWGELDKHAWSYAWPPERVKKLYLEYLDDRTYRLNGKPAGELEPPYPITAFAADWQYFDTLEAMPKVRGAR